MTELQTILPLLDVIINGFAKHFGSACEIVVHDYTSGPEQTIVDIVNGEVTGRHIGEGIMQVDFKIMPGEQVVNDSTDGLFNYITQTRDGRILKSSTIYIKDDNGTTIASICINNDITQLQQAKTYIEQFTGLNSAKPSPSDMVFMGGIDDLLIAMIHESIERVGVPTAAMTRDQKIAGIQYLKERGAFKIQKACDIIARFYDVSKFTVYNYLDEARGESVYQESNSRS